MGQPKYVIDYYEKVNGRCPTADFLDDLQYKDLNLIDKAQKRLAQYGHQIGRPYVDYLGHKIYELRVDIQRRTCRFLFFVDEGNKYVITHAFIKKSDKVPDSEIAKAIEYRNDHFSREVGR